MPELTPEACDMIEKFAAKLQTTSEHVYEVLVRQASVNAIVYGAGVIFFGILFIVCMLIIWHSIVRLEYHDGDMDVYAPAIFISGLIGAASFFIALLNVQPALQNIMNPEYTAISTLMSLIR